MRQASARLALTLAATVIISIAARPVVAERDGCLADEARERGDARASGDVLNFAEDAASGPIDIAFGTVRLRDSGGLLRTGASGCGMDVGLRLARDRVRVGMASLFSGDGVRDGNLAHATNWQHGRAEVDVLRRNGVDWRVGGSLLQVTAPDAERADRGVNAHSDVSLLDGRLQATTNLAWAEHGDAAGNWAGAQRHRIKLTLFEEGGFALTGFAGYERAEAGFAGRAVNLAQDRERETIGLGLRWRRFGLTLERRDERDNVDDDGDAGHRWDGWRGEARIDLDGRARMPRRATVSFDRRDRQDRLTRMVEERRDRLRVRFGWRDGLSLRLTGRSTTEFRAADREEVTNALGLAGERAFSWARWRLNGRAGASREWTDATGEAGMGVHISVGGRHGGFDSLDLRLKARLKRETEDDGAGTDTDYRIGLRAELAF